MLPSQYVINAGPGPKRSKITMMKTSPIEITAESLGSLMLIVATKTEVIVKRNQAAEKSLEAVKQRNVKGRASRYTVSK